MSNISKVIISTHNPNPVTREMLKSGPFVQLCEGYAQKYLGELNSTYGVALEFSLRKNNNKNRASVSVLGKARPNTPRGTIIEISSWRRKWQASKTSS